MVGKSYSLVTKVVAGSASQRLGKGLSEALKCDLVQIESKRFPDGEGYVRILSDVSGETVAIVQNTYPDQNMVELFLLQDATRRAGAKRIITVVPYFGYARQDKQFQPGEAISASALAKLIEAHSDATITVDLHNLNTLASFSKPVANASVMKATGEFLKGKADAILSPDKGSIGRAREAARVAGVQFDHIEKKRLDGSTVQMTPKELNVRGKRVAIVDDIIATGGTMMKAAEQLRAQGATRVIAVCTHGLFTGGALDKLRQSFDEVHACDTLESPASTISAAGSIAAEIYKFRS
ncbi:MAG: ribose-phosphate diphosphokinase [Euryarchaeota archaeon]|nr:ribose-phosphate diphosphokinase [Euryarchaeota archaeon]